MLPKRWMLIGGDRRAAHLEALLKRDGFEVDTLGLHEGDERLAQIGEADVLLFPYPFSVKQNCVPTLTGLTIHPEDVLSQKKSETLIIAGRGMENVLHYTDDERLEQRNAEISAEAAVCEVMQRTDRTLMDMRALVLGYGLFGRALALRLKRLGAAVWVGARRQTAREQAAEDGMRAVALDALCNVLPDMHMVLNTIAAQVLGDAELDVLPPGCWLLELASAPYGFDREAAQKRGLSCDVLPALPARYAPLSAAMALHDAALFVGKEAQS